MRLKVAHVNVEVVPMDAFTGDLANARGLWTVDTGTIHIDVRLAPPEQARVLIHELLHAIHDSFRLDVKPRDEEAICGDFDVPLATVFRDNPGLHVILHQALCNNKPIVKEPRK